MMCSTLISFVFTNFYQATRLCAYKNQRRKQRSNQLLPQVQKHGQKRFSV